jgi:hypothetical protein
VIGQDPDIEGLAHALAEQLFGRTALLQQKRIQPRRMLAESTSVDTT